MGQDRRHRVAKFVCRNCEERVARRNSLGQIGDPLLKCVLQHGAIDRTLRVKVILQRDISAHGRISGCMNMALGIRRSARFFNRESTGVPVLHRRDACPCKLDRTGSDNNRYLFGGPGQCSIEPPAAVLAERIGFVEQRPGRPIAILGPYEPSTRSRM